MQLVGELESNTTISDVEYTTNLILWGSGMDEFTQDAFANREEPVPLLTVTGTEDGGSSSEVEKDSKRKRLRKKLSASRIKEAARSLGADKAEKLDGSPSLQDRLFAKYVWHLPLNIL